MRREILALVLATVAHAGPPGASLTERFDATAPLVAAARKLFPTSAAATVAVTRTRDLERFGDGFRYETYHALDAKGQTLGELVRVQVHPDAISVIDIAVRLEGGKIIATEPVRPVMFGEKPFPHLPELFKRLSAHPVDRWAGGMALFYRGAAHLDEGHAGPRAAPTPSPGASPFMSFRQAQLATGDAFPDLMAKTLTGEAIDGSKLAGKPVLVVIFDPRDVRSQHMAELAADEFPKIKNCRLIPILESSAADVSDHRDRIPRRGVILPLAIVDEKRRLPVLFAANAVPYLAYFGPDGKLAWQSYWTTPESIRAGLAQASAKERR